MPFALRALDVDNGSEFVNDKVIDYCLSYGIELTRSRPYRKNDQAWIEQKNGAVVRKLLGYRRFKGIAAAKAIARLYGASRLFVSFFQPSIKLAAKHREGAQVSRHYYPPQTPCELEAGPDQTALELLLEFQARYPERYTLRQHSTMQRRLRVWRREAVKRLICDGNEMTQDVAAEKW